MSERREGGIDFPFVGGFQHAKLQGECSRRRLRRLQIDLSRRNARIHEKGNRYGIWCNSSNRFDPSVALKKLMPITFPPGRFRLVTNPWVTGSPGVRKTIGIVSVAAFAGSTPGKLETMDGDLTANEIGRSRRDGRDVGQATTFGPFISHSDTSVPSRHRMSALPSPV